MLNNDINITPNPARQSRSLLFDIDKNNGQLNGLIAMLSHRYCAYYPVLTRVCGNNPKASLMLSHSLQLTKIMLKNQPERDGWFWKTAKEWEAEIGLSQKEIESSRRALKDLGVLKEDIRGLPARCWFKIDLDRLAEVICLWANRQTQPWEWGNKELFALLGRPVIYYQAIARITHNAVAAIYLSHAISRYTQIDNDERLALNGWFMIAIADAEKRLAIGKKSLYDARLALEQAHLIKQMREKREDPRLLLKLNFSLIMKSINDVYEADKNNRLTAKGVTRVTDKKTGVRHLTVENNDLNGVDLGQKQPSTPYSMRTFQFGETRTFQNGETGRFQNGETSLPILESQLDIKYINTNINTPPTPPNQDTQTGKQGEVVLIHLQNQTQHATESAVTRVTDESVTRCNTFTHSENDFCWPKKAMLLPEERNQILTILAQVTLDKAQLILDEIDGRLNAGIKINLLIAYVRKLTRLTRENAFYPDHAHKVKAARVKQAELEAVRRVEAKKQAENRETNTNGEGYQGWKQFRSDNWKSRR